VFLLLINSIVWPAASQLSVEGRVVSDAEGEPLSRVHVQMLNTFRTAVTDAKGHFRMQNLPPGDYVLQLSHIGYGTLRKEVNLKKDVVLNLSLHREAVMAEEFVVQASRMDNTRAGAYAQLDKSDIADRNHGQDLPYLLSLTPSVVVTSDAGAGIGYTGLRIRGTDITRINVTLNGMPVNDPESQAVFWVNMPDLGSSLESIQVQRGVGTAANGAAAFGASINMSTLSFQPEAYAQLQSGAGSFNTFRNTLSFGTGLMQGGIAIDGRLSRITSDGYIDRAYSDLSSLYLSGGYFGKTTVVRLNLLHGQEKTYQAWDGVPSHILDTNRTFNGIGRYTLDDGSEMFYKNETDNYRQDRFQAMVSHEFTPQLRGNVSAYWIMGEGYYEQYKDSEKFTKYGLSPWTLGDSTLTRTDLIRQKWLDNDHYGISWSLNFDRRRMGLVVGGGWSEYLGDHFGEIIWAEHMPAGYANYQWYFNQGKKQEANIFGKISQQVTTRLNWNAELQYRYVKYGIIGTHDDLRDLSQSHRYSFLNPRTGLQYNWNDRHMAFALVAVTHREPTRSDIRDADPNRIPERERLTDLSAGYRYGGKMGKLEINGFHMVYQDQLILTGEINDVGASIFTNVPESYRSGMELSLATRPTAHWELMASLSLSRNRIRNFTAYVDNWDDGTQVEVPLGNTHLAFSPEMVASARVKYKVVKGFSIELLPTYVGKQFIDNTSSATRSLDAFLVNNLRFSYSTKPLFFNKIEINLLINNILNAEYETNAWVYRYFYTGDNGQRLEGVYDGYFPQAGRNFMLNLNIGI
jgi:iron complex outermembrane receptor protein